MVGTQVHAHCLALAALLPLPATPPEPVGRASRQAGARRCPGVHAGLCMQAVLQKGAAERVSTSYSHHSLSRHHHQPPTTPPQPRIHLTIKSQTRAPTPASQRLRHRRAQVQHAQREVHTLERALLQPRHQLGQLASGAARHTDPSARSRPWQGRGTRCVPSRGHLLPRGRQWSCASLAPS